MSTPVFEARAVSKSFGPIHALSNVSVTLNRGEIHSIIGENGAGKFTLKNIISGRLAPSEGQLFVDGAPVQFYAPKDAQQHGIAIAPQQISLVPDLTVYENILLGAHCSHLAGIKGGKRVRRRPATCMRSTHRLTRGPRFRACQRRSSSWCRSPVLPAPRPGSSFSTNPSRP